MHLAFDPLHNALRLLEPLLVVLAVQQHHNHIQVNAGVAVVYGKTTTRHWSESSLESFIFAVLKQNIGIGPHMDLRSSDFPLNINVSGGLSIEYFVLHYDWHKPVGLVNFGVGDFGKEGHLQIYLRELGNIKCSGEIILFINGVLKFKESP